MRYSRFLIIGIFAAACDRGNDVAAGQQVDPTQLTSAGEVSLTDGGSMSFNITSERYKQWDQARRAFPKSLITRFGQVLQPRAPSERSITNAVALLEGHPQARAAIERAGLSVRGFVEITVALEQQMMMASRGTPDASIPQVDGSYPMTMDSGYYPAPAYTPPPVMPLPQPYPVQPYPPAQPYTPVLPPPRDTVRRDTVVPTPMPLPVPRPDTVPTRRDTAPAPAPMPAPRDTVAPKPAPRDTARDSSRVTPAPAAPITPG